MPRPPSQTAADVAAIPPLFVALVTVALIGSVAHAASVPRARNVVVTVTPAVGTVRPVTVTVVRVLLHVTPLTFQHCWPPISVVGAEASNPAGALNTSRTPLSLLSPDGVTVAVAVADAP